MKATFKCIPVEIMPHGSAEWRKLSIALLALCSEGLDPSLQAEFAAFYNHAWDSGLLWHWCLPGCPRGGGDASATYGFSLLERVFLNFAAVPLLYRWKHFEPSAGYVMRGIIFNFILVTVLRLALADLPEVTEEDVRQASEIDADIAPSLRQAIRGKRTLQTLTAKTTPRDICRALFLAKPLAWFMNLASEAETETNKALVNVNMETYHPGLLQATAKLNAEFVTGRHGYRVVRRYLKLLTRPLDSTTWTALGLVGDETEDGPILVKVFVGAVSSMSEAWKRLLHKFRCAPWRLFWVVFLADDASSESRARWLAEELQTLREFPCCAELFSKSLSGMIQRGEISVPGAVAWINEIAAQLRVSSVAVEKQHVLHKQGAKLSGTRGMAKHPNTIQRMLAPLKISK